jgi:hypothetical protein
MCAFPLRLLAIAFAIGSLCGCWGNGGDLGDSCDGNSDCRSSLQCSNDVCVPRCARAPDCGDGYSCDEDGLCQRATGQPGDSCKSETDCAPGLTCTIDDFDEDGVMNASCSAQRDAGRPPGAECDGDSSCRDGVCTLGHCSGLCADTRDCEVTDFCTRIPSIETPGALFNGCIQAKGNIRWNIPNVAPTGSFLLPVPEGAHSAQVVFSVDDLAQRVGAKFIAAPSGQQLFNPCSVFDTGCDPERSFYEQLVRHQPLFGQSVVSLPSATEAPLEVGAYRFQVASYLPNGTIGSAIPHLTASVRIDSASLLDLHFNFLDLENHMCESAFGGVKLDAERARNQSFFQTEFLGELVEIFAHGGVVISSATYKDVLGHADLDGLDVADAGSLLELGDSATGINVFFVRTLSPVGLQAFGPNPGPAGIANTRQSGIIIGLDTLCYRSWSQLARVTAHELARYMGLHHNVELGADSASQHWEDQIWDTDESDDNLMFFSEFGGIDITPDQRDILTRSGVLR